MRSGACALYLEARRTQLSGDDRRNGVAKQVQQDDDLAAVRIFDRIYLGGDLVLRQVGCRPIYSWNRRNPDSPACRNAYQVSLTRKRRVDPGAGHFQAAPLEPAGLLDEPYHPALGSVGARLSGR